MRNKIGVTDILKHVNKEEKLFEPIITRLKKPYQSKKIITKAPTQLKINKVKLELNKTYERKEKLLDQRAAQEAAYLNSLSSRPDPDILRGIGALKDSFNPQTKDTNDDRATSNKTYKRII